MVKSLSRLNDTWQTLPHSLIDVLTDFLECYWKRYMLTEEWKETYLI